MKYGLVKNKNSIVILALIILLSCTPDRFTLDKISGQNRIDGFELRTISDATAKYDNAFILNENGIVSLRAAGETDGVWDFGLNFLYGSDLNIVLRDVAYEFREPYALMINISNDIVSIQNFGQTDFKQKTKCNFSKTVRVQIINDGFNYSLVLDCDTVYKGRTKTPNTEFIIFESIDNTKAFVSGIDFKRNSN